MARFAFGTLCRARGKALFTYSLGIQLAPIGAVTDLRSAFRRMAFICLLFTPTKPSACGTPYILPKEHAIRFPLLTRQLEPWRPAENWPLSGVGAANWCCGMQSRSRRGSSLGP